MVTGDKTKEEKPLEKLFPVLVPQAPVKCDFLSW